MAGAEEVAPAARAEEVTFADLDALGLQKPAVGQHIVLEVVQRVSANWPQTKQLRVIDRAGDLRNVFLHFDQPEPHFSFTELEAGAFFTVEEPKAHAFMDGSMGLRLETPSGIRVAKQPISPERRVYYAECEKADGTKFFGMKRWDMAIDRYGYALHQLDEVNAEHVTAETKEKRDSLTATLYLNLAACALQKKKYADAVQHCLRTLALRPDWPKAHFRLAEAQHALQELEKAEASYQRALELLPEDKAIRKGLAAVRKDLADRRATEAGLFKGMFQKAPKG
eukprot:EG_transcript_17296